MRWLALVLLSGLFWLQASVSLAAPVLETMQIGGDARNYWLYRPEGLDKAKPAPLQWCCMAAAARVMIW